MLRQSRQQRVSLALQLGGSWDLVCLVLHKYLKYGLISHYEFGYPLDNPSSESHYL